MKELVRIARETVERVFQEGRLTIKNYEKFKEKRGVFVTIMTYPAKELRGCIGFPQPIYPLEEATQRAAYAAAFEDTRFPPLKKEELSKIIFEVSVLTLPKLIEVKKPEEYLRKIEIGKDGLIIQLGWHTGLLLPQVATEFKWNVEEFLQNLCMKAGLTPDIWIDPQAKIYKFQAKIFREVEPKGEIEEA